MKRFLQLIQRVSRDVDEPYLLEDIQSACRKKQAFCFGDESTCVVVRRMERAGDIYLLVWLGVSTGPGALEKFNPIVTDLARATGAGWFEFCTTRRGFIRVAEKLGFVRRADDKQGRMWFSKEVN